MSPVNVYDRPASADRSPLKIIAAVLVALDLLALVGWALLSNKDDSADDQVVTEPALEVEAPGTP